MKHKLIPVEKKSDIPPAYRNTPIGLLLEYHNLKRSHRSYTRAQLLIGMCMDNRKHLHVPDNFAYIIRTGGANLRASEFKVSYAIAVGGVRHIALIAHNHCAMVNLAARKQAFVEGLASRAGWTRAAAEEHFLNLAPWHEIGNEQDFIVSEQQRLSQKYPKIQIASLYYRVENNRLYCMK